MIIGCGYVGQGLAPKLITLGHQVTCTNTSEKNHEALTKLGALTHVFDLKSDFDHYQAMLGETECIFFLAPPTESIDAHELAKKIKDASPKLKTLIYGSTTGVFGNRKDASQWIDESTICGPRNTRGQRRADMEDALLAAEIPTKIVRICGIYGPGRTLYSRVKDPSWPVFEGAPETSRIHVEDLVQILCGMLQADAPDLLIACDEEPATTLDVAQHTCALLGRSALETVSRETAKSQMSELAWQFRTSGRRCRSLYRANLVAQLKYPSYREGVAASLQADGLI